MKFSWISTSEGELSSLQNWSRRFVGFGIAGLYLSLLIAGIFYMTDTEAALANMHTNQFLVSGVFVSVCLLATGWSIFLLHRAGGEKSTSGNERCPLLCDTNHN